MTGPFQTFQNCFVRGQIMLLGSKFNMRHRPLSVQHVIPGTAGNGHNFANGTRVDT